MTTPPTDLPSCTEPELHQLLGSWELGLLTDQEAQRVEAHALQCDACFEDLYGGAPAAERLRRTPIGSVPRSTLIARPRPVNDRRVLIGSLAASILLVAVLGVLAPWQTGENGAEHARGSDDSSFIRVRTPVGAVALPVRFDWEVVSGAREYRVRLNTARGLLLWEASVVAPPTDLPEEVRDALEPSTTHYWQVEAIGPDGRLAKSALTGFTVAR